MSQPLSGDLVKSGASAIFASVVRTVVPLLVGLLVAGFTKVGVSIDDDSAALVVNGLLSGLISLGYYVIARVLETFGSSRFGWLLGFAKSPVYVAPVPASKPAEDVAVRVDPEV